MPILFYVPQWGNTLLFDQCCRNVKAAGYNGVEMALPLESAESRTITDPLKQHGPELIGQYFQSFGSDLEEHSQNYEKYLRYLAAALNTAQKIVHWFFNLLLIEQATLESAVQQKMVCAGV